MLDACIQSGNITTYLVYWEKRGPQEEQVSLMIDSWNRTVKKSRAVSIHVSRLQKENVASYHSC